MFDVIDTPCYDPTIKDDNFNNHLYMYKTLCNICASKQTKGECEFSDYCIDHCQIARACADNYDEFVPYIEGYIEEEDD